MAKLNFQQPLLWSSVSHDPSEILIICWIGAQIIFLIINNEEKSFAANIFVETIILFFRIIYWIERCNERHLLDIEIIRNVFTVTFGQFNVSWLIVSNHFLLTNLWTVV